MKQDDSWEYMYNLLVQYKDEYGNIDVKHRYITKDLDLILKFFMIGVKLMILLVKAKLCFKMKKKMIGI